MTVEGVFMPSISTPAEFLTFGNAFLMLVAERSNPNLGQICVFEYHIGQVIPLDCRQILGDMP